MSGNKQDNDETQDENGPGVDNGIPEDARQGESTALPDSKREQSETAGKPDA